jgi:membrane peptidoglycan carboxypeptidase
MRSFLVCLIPSPVRYHQAHASGRVGRGMDQLMANLLAKLRSVDALTEEEYEQALGEELRFQPEGEPVELQAAGTD